MINSEAALQWSLCEPVPSWIFTDPILIQLAPSESPETPYGACWCAIWTPATPEQENRSLGLLPHPRAPDLQRSEQWYAVQVCSSQELDD